jgi:hypothetical protein
MSGGACRHPPVQGIARNADNLGLSCSLISQAAESQPLYRVYGLIAARKAFIRQPLWWSSESLSSRLRPVKILLRMSKSTPM